MTKWKAIERLLGESIRDIGILVLVFAPLDAAFAEGPIDVMLVTFLAGWALVAIALGIVVEVGE